jgi:hypothetical protein
MSTVMPKNSPSVASRNSSMSFMFRRSPNGLVRSQNVRHIAVAADRHGVETFATTSHHHALVLPANSPTIHRRANQSGAAETVPYRAWLRSSRAWQPGVVCCRASISAAKAGTS